MINVTDAELERYQKLGYAATLRQLGTRSKRLVFHSEKRTMILMEGQCIVDDLPTLRQKAINLASTVVAAIKSPEPIFAHKEIANNRLVVCQACDYYVADTCRSCGCKVSTKVKINASHCPNRKW